MRFNDLLRTVLAQGGEGRAASVTRWRQCIDLLAQYDVSGALGGYRLTDDDVLAVFAVLEDLRKRLGPEQRVAPLVELGGRLRSVRLCRFLAQDHPAVVAAAMTRTRLSDADWAEIIPALGPLARSILRRRSDLGPAAQAALTRFGPTDFALPAATGAMTFSPANDVPGSEPEAEAGPGADAPDAAPRVPNLSQGEASEIRKIVERIERYTAKRGAPHAMRAGEAALDRDAGGTIEPQGAPLLGSFAFQTDDKGRFRTVDDVPRAAVLGLGIGEAAVDGRSGADGQALGAFRRRAAFRDARFAIASGALAGEWRLTGDPRFDRASGLFLGYEGTARRERAHEQLVRAGNIDEGHPPKAANGATGAGMDWSALSAAGARQLIHELRTPLSAIHAYAEMIEGQLVGPVSSEYREIAAQIIADARELVATFDDLDLAGRIARGENGHKDDAVDLAGELRGIVQRFDPSGGQRIVVDAGHGLPPVCGVRDQIERMLSHLLRAGYSALDEDEALNVGLRFLPVTGTVSVSMRRPRALRGHSETMLLDHASPIDQMFPEAPPLGLAFALQLVRGIAARMGGQLLISADAFEIVLPAAKESESGRERGA